MNESQDNLVLIYQSAAPPALVALHTRGGLMRSDSIDIHCLTRV